MFNSPNTAAMMGAVPAHRRGIAAGARTLVQNTGAVLSIAFVLAIVTSAVPKATLFAVFSGLTKGLSEQKLAPFIANMHAALWVLAATSLVGTAVCLMRPRHVIAPALDGASTLEPQADVLAAEMDVRVGAASDRELGRPAARNGGLHTHDGEVSPPSVPAARS
jgi:hypothetical protein